MASCAFPLFLFPFPLLPTAHFLNPWSSKPLNRNRHRYLKGGYVSWASDKINDWVELKDPHSCYWKDQQVKLLCSSEVTAAHPVRGGVLSCLGETEDEISVKVKLWEMFFMG